MLFRAIVRVHDECLIKLLEDFSFGLSIPVFIQIQLLGGLDPVSFPTAGFKNSGHGCDWGARSEKAQPRF